MAVPDVQGPRVGKSDWNPEHKLKTGLDQEGLLNISCLMCREIN